MMMIMPILPVWKIMMMTMPMTILMKVMQFDTQGITKVWQDGNDDDDDLYHALDFHDVKYSWYKTFMILIHDDEIQRGPRHPHVKRHRASSSSPTTGQSSPPRQWPYQYRIHVGMPIWLCIHIQLVDVSWTQRQEDVIGEKHLSTGSNQHPHWSHLIMVNNRWVRPKRVSAANERGRLGYGEGARLKVKLMLLFVPLLKIFFISSSNSLCSKYQT